MPSASSQGSEDSTKDSDAPGSLTLFSASPTPGEETCCEHASSASPSQTPFVRSTNPHGDHYSPLDDERWEQRDEAPTLSPHSATQRVLISSAADSPAKTSASPDNDAASPGNAQASSSNTPVSPRLFDPEPFSSRTY